MKFNVKGNKFFIYLLISFMFIFSIAIAVAFEGVIITAPGSSDFWDDLDTPADINLTDLGDVNATAPGDGEVLVFNATTSLWGAGPAGSGLGDITGVLTSLTAYLLGGCTSGTCSLDFNETLLNATIDARGGGSGDITNVQGDGTYVYNGSASGAVLLAFNETKLNLTILDLDTNESTRFGNLVGGCGTTDKVSGVLVNGTINCSTDQSSAADFTNVAFLNNTQTFTQLNTFPDIRVTNLANITAFITSQGNLRFNFYASGVDLILNVSNGGGDFEIMQENSKIKLFNTPTAANDFKVFQIFSKEAADVTEFTITKAGTALTSYFVRSLSLVGNATGMTAPHNCTTFANFIDCNTDLTGPDFFVHDDIELEGTIYVGEGVQANDWTNLTNLTDTLYAGIEFDYNQTDPDTNETVRVNNLVNDSCGAGDFVNDISLNGTVVCGTPAAGGGDNSTWNETRANDLYVNVVGDTMTGSLNMSENNITGVDHINPDTQSTLNVDPYSTGDVIAQEYDLRIGSDVSGALRLGNSRIASGGNMTVDSAEFNGTLLFLMNGTIDSVFEFVIGRIGENIRFAIPKAGVDYAMQMVRSVMVGGDTAGLFNDNIVNCTAQGYLLIDCDTNATGADLGVQDDIEVRGTAFINESLLADIVNVTFGMNALGGANISSNWFFGNINFSDVQNHPSTIGFALNFTTDDGNGSILDSEVMNFTGTEAITTAGSGNVITINHSDTSTQADVDNSGNTFLQDITFDTFGHVLSIVSAAVSSVGDFFFANFTDSFDSNFTAKTTDDLSQGSSNFYDNRTWNETLADTLYSVGAHTTDTNASTACSGTNTYLDGEGNCDDISNVYVNVTGDLMTGDLIISGDSDLNVTGNITALDRLCLNSGCSSFIYNNGTDSIWV